LIRKERHGNAVGFCVEPRLGCGEDKQAGDQQAHTKGQLAALEWQRIAARAVKMHHHGHHEQESEG
jgi:hypothetical protein